MATSSITKEFVVKDEAAFKKLLEDIKKAPPRRKTAYEESSLCKGREALKQFLSH